MRFDDLTTIVNDPQLAVQVLLDRERVYAIRENFLGEALSQEQIAETRGLRPSLNPGMRRVRAVRIMPSVVSLTELELHAADGELVDPHPMLERVSALSIAHYYFGPDAHVVVDATRELLESLEGYFGNPFALPATWPTPGRRRIAKRHGRLEAIVVPLVQSRAHGTTPDDQDLATCVVRALTGEGGASFERVGQMLIGSLLAAQRIPAAAAAWMLWEVAQREELQSRLRAEETGRWASAVSSSAVTRVSDFPLATAVVLEALRLHPPTWLLHRTSMKDSVIGDYAVPRGHNLLVSPYVLHRDGDHFADPDRFCIDRWGEGRRPALTSFIPFGRGPHGCPGNEVALAMLVAILLTTLGRCDVAPGPGSVVPDPRSSLVPSGLRLSFSRR